LKAWDPRISEKIENKKKEKEKSKGRGKGRHTSKPSFASLSAIE
jgi:hypothetical protein